MTHPATGLKSASGQLTILGVIAGIVSALEGVLTPGTTAHTAVYGGGGILVGLGSVLSKLAHDKGIHIATIQQAGSDIAAQLPQLTRDASIAAGFVAHDLPSLSAKVDALATKVTPTVEELKPVVAAVLASFNTPAPPQP